MRGRSDYWFHLPPAQIAQVPVEDRDASRLLIVAPDGPLCDRHFSDIVAFIPEDAVLVVNDVRVIPARLRTVKPTGGAVELLFLEPERDAEKARPGCGSETWRCLARSSKALRPGMDLRVRDGNGEVVTVLHGRDSDATIVVALPQPALDLLDRYGEVPLPPYIARPGGPDRFDRERYQTVYADRPGAVAAPTAGLHFTDNILDRLRGRGVTIAPLTLHVGLGTFAPMRVEAIDDHVMHEERYAISESSARAINRALAEKRPVIAVGTTCVRALESAAARSDIQDAQTGPGLIPAGPGATDLFIRPGYRFRVVDRLITNFHLPESTLLMLVCALGGYDRLMAAYRHAVAAGYRFFSYGDAMLVWRS
ncbi:MAG: tRNA preQ1(34) S-adenosylmethionine ribosyltransferase-isomerase QueA [Proteobacteria bacterium]|nr:tRNA preQ1(34) S-adenosylmethionine ribosyltransferase-isomerase QueA [Pseudomonadota bacterium]